MGQCESPAGQEHRCDFLERNEKRVDIHELLLTAVRAPKRESIIWTHSLAVCASAMAVNRDHFVVVAVLVGIEARCMIKSALEGVGNSSIGSRPMPYSFWTTSTTTWKALLFYVLALLVVDVVHAQTIFAGRQRLS